MARPRNRTPWIKFYSVYHPLQQAEHVKAYSQWVFEEDQRWTRRLRGEEGPPLNFHKQDIEMVLAELRKPIKG